MSIYRISSKAVSDLEDIWLYTFENWSLEQADRYYQLIIDEIEHLSKYPFSGKSIDEVKQDYRVSKVKSHLIIHKTADIIEVVRILYQNMDIENRLSG